MSMDHSIYMNFDLEFTQKNVQFVLQKASNFDFVYLTESEDKKLFDIGVRYFNVEQAILKLSTMAKNMTDYERPFLRIKYQDTDFFLRLYEDENKLITMGVAVFGFRWDKQFERGSRMYTIDFSRYIRLLMKMCGDLNILTIETSSDMVEGVQYTNQNCVTALIDMGSFKEVTSGSIEGVRGSFRGLIDNALENKFVFFNQDGEKQIQSLIEECYENFKAGFPLYLYAAKDNFSFKIEIKKNEQGYDFVSVYRLEPYLMKKGYGSEDEKIDVAFYTQRLLELCENFAIYELKTFF
jgi:hypothetical protein